ncbi:hypothetical protein GH975_09505 [Litorivicinus lipolyticus]|uniref:Cytochrome c assembly protein domain-containing protein n=1 Tax=Litorivicinus lipolyticus TaxID=418701 RepID=A0A5Q2QG38_9GAMM|nr:cytochrome c biogenesis protein CcsA [Litorivicinus lipolyticus]QGG80790.1 hypothetical protein GH975_09505 [Litorivicinus lipolyticus]
MNPILLSVIAAGGYALAAAIEARHIDNDRREHKRVFVAAMTIALACHLWVVLSSLGGQGETWTVSLIATLSLSAWMIGVVVVGLRLRQRQGILLAPLLAAVSVIALGSGFDSMAGRSVTSNLGLATHIVLSLAAFSVLFIAGAQSLLLGWQNRALKQHHFSAIAGLPSMKRMEVLLFDLLTSGWMLLSAALLTGWAFIDDLFAQHLLHKTVLSAAAWLVFSGLLIGRRLFGWRGATATAWTLTGFGVLALGTLGSKIMLELVLDRV